MVAPAIAAAGITVAAGLLKTIAQSLPGHGIASAVINSTAFEMTLIDSIHTHHGQYDKAPPPTIKAAETTVEAEETEHPNVVVVEIGGAGAGAAESIFGYEFQNNEKTYRLCFYIKHGHHIESGTALWEKGSEVDGEDYDVKINKAAESLIHTIQKNRSQTSYSKDGEGASVELDGIKVSHSSGKTFKFEITET